MITTGPTKAQKTISRLLYAPYGPEINKKGVELIESCVGYANGGDWFTD